MAGCLSILISACSGPRDEIASLPHLSAPYPARSDAWAWAGAAPRLRTVAYRPLKPAEIVTPSRPLQCVPYARELSRIEIRGDAWAWWRRAKGRYGRGDRPAVGSVLVLKPRYQSRGHVAVVTAILNDREIVVSHANWLNEGRIHKNTPVRDVSRANDWSAARFWHTPTGRYGARTYPIQGFIHPNTATAAR